MDDWESTTTTLKDVHDELEVITSRVDELGSALSDATDPDSPLWAYFKEELFGIGYNTTFLKKLDRLEALASLQSLAVIQTALLALILWRVW